MTALEGVGDCKKIQYLKDDDTSCVNLIQSKARYHDQVKVIFDNYTKVSSLKESKSCRGNSKGIRSNIVDYSTCIKFLYLTAEYLVIVPRNDVNTNSYCPLSTGVSIPKEANSRLNQHIMEVTEIY